MARKLFSRTWQAVNRPKIKLIGSKTVSQTCKSRAKNVSGRGHHSIISVDEPATLTHQGRGGQTSNIISLIVVKATRRLQPELQRRLIGLAFK